MLKSFAILLFITVLGCSPADYRRSADFDVNRMLKDRQTSTLDYQPREPLIGKEPEPVRRNTAYAKIPQTMIPPATQPVFDRSVAIIPFGPVGPQMLLPEGVPMPEMETYVDPLQASQERQIRRLMLGPPSPFEKIERLDLFRSLSYAVLHSPTYQTQSESMYLSALEVTLQRHLLSPRPFARTGLEFTGGQADADYQHALNATGAVGVRQRLPYGGEIVAQALVGFVNALSDPVNSGETAQVILSGSIPLMRGAGLVNLEGLINSERQLVYQVRAFEEFRRDFAVNVADAYFRLLTLQQRVNNRRLNLESFMLLTARASELFAAGKQTFLEVQRSMQSQYQAENSLIDAQDAYETAVDNFKIQIGMNVEDRLDIVPVVLEFRLPEIDTDQVYTKALHYRLDLQTARDRVEDARREVANTQNGLGPDLNLTASGVMGNRPQTPARQFDSRTSVYSAGIELDLPIDRVAERNDYRRALIELDRRQREAQDLSQRIIADVRDVSRSIRTSAQAVEIQRNSIELAERRMEYATDLLREGRPGITARDVVEAQNSLLTAQDSYDQAQANLQILVLQFLRETGTLRLDKSAGALGQALDRMEALAEQNPGKRVH